jgi:glycerol uptake facilitator-like aquaporin
VFLNEFVVDFMLALVIFGCTDPTNLLVPPAMGVWVVALAYAVAIWGFSVNGRTFSRFPGSPGRGGG